VTNKIGRFASPLIAALGLADRSGCSIYGDSAEQRKPHPAPLLLAAERLGVTPAECVYIGDARTDVVAASSAGMRCWVARYGYLGPEDRPETWCAERLIDRPGDILDILNQGE
jgi:phosphoglycolate phosphatase